MALVVICGQPCSGKSTAAKCLAEALRDSESTLTVTVRVIDETFFHLDRNQGYANMTAEKNIRGVLRSEVDRSVCKDNIIIVDSLNSIKGYRYELWCLARAAGVRYCVLYSDVVETDCRKWNEERREKGEATYDENIFDDLVTRFEKPESRNRWDSPLFELQPSKSKSKSKSKPKHGIDKSLPAIVDAVSYLTKKVDSRTKDIKILQPTIATQNGRPSEANSLYELDRATQEVMTAIVAAQSQALGGPLNGISIAQGLPTINIQSVVGLPELRRLRRTFMKLTGQSSLKCSTSSSGCRKCKEDVCGLFEPGTGIVGYKNHIMIRNDSFFLLLYTLRISLLCALEMPIWVKVDCTLIVTSQRYVLHISVILMKHSTIQIFNCKKNECTTVIYFMFQHIC
ncbi:hypothetical protein SOVF_139340 [Spinacia oleracea]|nr:hypothetical protein SOVF_139340 [Spinacia oleracea]